MKIVLPEQVIELPIQLDDRFTPPDLEELLDFYPALRERGGNWSFAGYLSWILKQIDRAKPQGYTGEEAFNEFVYWLGGLPVFVSRYRGLA